MTGDVSHACGAEVLPGPGQRGASTGSFEVGRKSGVSLSRASETKRPNALKYASATGSDSDRPIGQRPE